MVLLTLFLAVAGKIYNKHKSSVDAEDISDVIEELNSEMVVWTDDLSYIHMNKMLRDQVGSDKLDNRQQLMTVFGLNSDNPEMLEKVIRNQSYEVHFQNVSGGLTSIAWSTSLMKKRKKNSLYLSAGFNLTEIKKMKVNLASANDFFNSSMELAEIGVLMTTDKKKYFASPEMVRMLGLRSSNVSLGDFRSLVHPNDRMIFDGAMNSEESPEVKSIEIRIKSRGGSYRWYSYRYKFIEGTDNTLPLFGGAVIDVTQEHEKDILIERLAYIDEVTEIANRNKLMDIGQETYECCQLLNYSYWIVVLDIDRFHIINDTCGYTNGNYILRNFAHILYKFVTPGGLAARISGDNFALVLRDYGDDELPVRTVISPYRTNSQSLQWTSFSSISLSCSAGYSQNA